MGLYFFIQAIKSKKFLYWVSQNYSGGETKFFDFFFSYGHSQQNVGKNKEFSGMGPEDFFSIGQKTGIVS